MASPFKGIHAPAVEIFPEKGTGREGGGRKGDRMGRGWKVREEKGREGMGGKERKCIIFPQNPPKALKLERYNFHVATKNSAAKILKFSFGNVYFIFPIIIRARRILGYFYFG